jgi:hypothetical protein
MVIVPQEDQQILYESYVELFKINKKYPNFFTDMRLNSSFTALMLSRKWAWNVIGISKNAYLACTELHFKKRPKNILVRGHITQRIDTFRLLFDRIENPSRTEPYSFDEFWETYLPNDQTILMTREENGVGKVIPHHHKFNNDEFSLFTNDGNNFDFKEKEKKFLSKLDVKNFD